MAKHISVPPNRTEQDVIETAYVTAAMRALLSKRGRIRNPDYLAHHFVGPKWGQYLKVPWLFHWYVEQRIPGCCYYHLVRTRHFDALLLKTLLEGDFTQLVLLGAGYDTRPYRFASKLGIVTTFEVDLPGTQSVKKSRIHDVIGEPENRVEYVAVDFQKDDLLGCLRAHGYDTGAKTIFLWEGVTYFLTADAIERTLAFMSNQSVLGSVIMFDYALRAYVEGDLSFYGASEIARELRRIDEPHLFGLDANEISAFLARFHYQIESDLGSDALEQLYLRDERGQPYGKAHAFNRIVCARRVE
jgi:methyltransferase (TIGR00027 family)